MSIIAEKPSRLFLRSRLKAIWYLLTKPWFILVHAGGEPLKAGLNYNVNREGFKVLIDHVAVAHEDHERQAELLNEAKSLLP